MIDISTFRNIIETAKAHERREEWKMAAQQYRAAADMILADLDKADPDQQDDLRKSAERLMYVSDELDRRVVRNHKQPMQSSNVPSRLHADGKDEPIFTPVSETPNVRFADIVGLEKAKKTIMRSIVNRIKCPELYERFGIPNQTGIILYGPPGTGKTTLGRAIATEIDADFYYIKCSDIVDKYFGQAEKRVRALFDEVRSKERAILFLDEFDALATKRGGDSTVMNRLVPELLGQMDGFDKPNGQLVIIAATNRPFAIDSAFLRRLPSHVYVGLPDEDARRQLIRRILDTYPSESIDVEKFVKATEGYSCNDITNLMRKAFYSPIDRGIAEHDNNQFLKEKDLEEALEDTYSTVDPTEIHAIEKWQAKFYKSTDA